MPSLVLGCFGSHTPLASHPANRTALFDVSLAGPATGAVGSLAVAVVGLALTATATPQAVELMPSLPFELLHGSLLASLLTEAALGPPSATASANLLHLHPLAIAGLAGLVTNAVSVLPCGRTDGGRLAMAHFGRRGAAALGGFTLLLLGTGGLFADDSHFAVGWALILVLLLRQPEMPSVDEVTPLDEERSRLLLPLALLVLATLCPAPHAAADGFSQEVLQYSMQYGLESLGL